MVHNLMVQYVPRTYVPFDVMVRYGFGTAEEKNKQNLIFIL